MRTKPTALSLLDTCKYVLQCEREPRQDARRDRATFSTWYRLEFVASQCQHAERTCVRIDDPVFLHAEAGVERSFDIQISGIRFEPMSLVPSDTLARVMLRSGRIQDW